MKYDKETTEALVSDYQNGSTVDQLSEKYDAPVKSIIAKLSHLGVYKKKVYLNKRGETPVKKEEYIERIAQLLNVNLELIESLEKANKNVLVLLEKALSDSPFEEETE